MSNLEEGVGEMPTPQQLGGATKKARNREKLMNAVDYLMRRQKSNETVSVGDVCEEAGISSATFYTFWKSRNELCVDAFVQFVVEPLEATDTEQGREFAEAARALIRLTKGREKLLQAALIGRLERPSSLPARGLHLVLTDPDEGTLQLIRSEDADFVERVAYQLWRRQDQRATASERETPKKFAAMRMSLIGLIVMTAGGLLEALAREDYDMAEAIPLLLKDF